MANVFDVAKYILEKMGKLSTWKLQKLVYYSQAWALAWTEKPLFDEDFEAWSNGPVCRELFNSHKGKYAVTEDDIPNGDISKLSDDEKDTIDVVIEGYGNMLPFELRQQTHNEDPWINARGGLPDGVPCDTVITKDDIKFYYESL
ncbi:MAG: DUF4065 domain-containing protein [Eubacterium sp.]|nr:DUF4065 domain-containing protein [Eubacterium sp.]